MKKVHLGVIIAGAAVGLAALILTALGNPTNMGFCIACFLRDISGAVGLHSAAKVQYVRPEIIGLVLGAFIMSVASKEFKARAGSSPAIRFVLGAFVVIGALAFLGCPLRMVLRLGGGDLNALVGLIGFFIGILIGIVAALIMNHTAFRGKPVPFVMELPNYRLPGLKNVVQLLWEKARDFLERAFTVIFLATIIIWFLQNFDFQLSLTADPQESILAWIASGIAPLFAPLGFGDWRVSTALITGFMAKESVVSTLTILYGSSAALGAALSPAAAAPLLVFCLLYTPCIAAVASVKREMGGRWATVMVVNQCVVAWLAALIVRFLAVAVL